MKIWVTYVMMSHFMERSGTPAIAQYFCNIYIVEDTRNLATSSLQFRVLVRYTYSIPIQYEILSRSSYSLKPRPLVWRRIWVQQERTRLVILKIWTLNSSGVIAPGLRSNIKSLLTLIAHYMKTNRLTKFTLSVMECNGLIREHSVIAPALIIGLWGFPACQEWEIAAAENSTNENNFP